MIKLKLAALAFILLGPCALAYARKGARAERTLPAALCAQSLALIFLGYLLPFSVCVGVLTAVSAACWGYALLRVRDVRRAAGFFSPACLIFLLGVLLLYDACAPRLFLSYDEHSHWGLIVKVISVFDELPRAGRGAAYIQFTYPPSTAMLPAMAASILGYRDGVACFGYVVLLLGLLLGLTDRAGRWAPCWAALIYLCMMAVFPLGVLRLFCEPAVALLMALLIVRLFDRDGQCLWESALYAAMLAMTKNTGLVFVLLCVTARLCAQPDRREMKRAACMLLCGALAVWSYQTYCGVQGIEATISPSHFDENLAALLSGTLGEPYTSLPRRFAGFLFGAGLPQSGVYSCYGFATAAAVLGVTLLMCGAHLAVARDKRRAGRLWLGVWLGNAAYMAMIVVSYFFFFEEAEVERLAEADRYTMLIALWTAVMAVVLLLRERETPRRRVRAALLCALTAAMLPLSHMDMTVKTFITREYVQNTVWAREQTEQMAAFLREQLSGEEDARLLCMGDYPYVELHYALAGDIDIGRIDRSWDGAPWAGDAQAVAGVLEDGMHVFVAGLTDEDAQRVIDSRYAVLTVDGAALQAHSLYRAQAQGDGSVRLVYLATMPEQEA